MERKFEKSLRISWKEGIPASVMVGVTDYYLVPLGLFLGASTRAISLLVALPQFLSSLTQPVSVAAVRWAGSRLRFVVAAAAAQALILVPIALLALRHVPGGVWLLIAMAVVFRVTGNLVATSWGSLVSEYLPPQQRGRYFGWRSRVTGVANLAGVAGGGLLLYFAKEGLGLAAGFFALFLTIAALRGLSAWMLSKMEDLPTPAPAKGSEFTFLMFLRRVRESNFVRFTLFVAGITFSTALAGPYFSVYVLRDLQMSYLQYMTIHLCSVAAGLVGYPIWGKHADWFGNAGVLKVTGWIVPVLPWLWVVSDSFLYLIPVNLFAGFIWGGFTLCSTNFVYDAVTPEKRVRCLSYFSMLSGLAIASGSLIGGYLAEHLPPVRGRSMCALFLFSGFARLMVCLALAHGFQEVRATARRISSLKLFFSVVGVRPIPGDKAGGGSGVIE